MDKQRKKTFYIILGFVISIVLIWLLFRKINFIELKQALEQANYWWLIPNVILVALTMYIRAFRWEYMLRPIKKVAFNNLAAATWIGFMANNILPLRLGEFVRAYSLAYQDRGVTKSAALANIFVERMVFDLVALLLIFGSVLFFSQPMLDDDIRRAAWLASAIALIGIVFIFFLAIKPRQSGKFLVGILFFLPSAIKEKIQETIMKFSRGLEFLKDPKMITIVSVQTIIIWIIMGLSNYFVFIAFGMKLPLAASFVLLVVVSISILIPSAPGFIGVYHAGAVWTLNMYGIGHEKALSFAIVLHAAQYLTLTLGGFYYLKKEHLSLKKLEDEAAEEIE